MLDELFPLVTVIVRSLNRATLAQTIASICAQNYPSIQIVIVNAGPQTAIALPAAEGPFPIEVSVPTAEGLSRSAAANLGLDMAQGSLALFVDDDDWIEPDHIRGLVQSLGSGDASLIASYSSTRCVDAKGHPRPEMFGSPFDATRLLIGNFIPIHACLFRLNEQTRSCRFDESLPLYEDWDYWMQLTTFGNFSFHDACTAVYRLGSESGFGVTGGDSPLAREAYRRVLSKWQSRWSPEQIEHIIERARLSYGPSTTHQAPQKREIKLTSKLCASKLFRETKDAYLRLSHWLTSLD